MDFKKRNMIDKDYKEIIHSIKNIGINFLERANLLEITVKELLISDLIKNISLEEEQSREVFEDYLKKNGLVEKSKLKEFLNKNNFSKEILKAKLIRSFKIQNYFLNEFKSIAKEFFMKNKSSYLKVTYSLIRTSDFQLAKELYLQIEAKEENIYDLAAKYSQGEEKFSKGLIGPIPLNQSHNKIIQKINSSKEGELHEPFQIDNWWIILKLEKIFNVDYSDQIEINICRDLFEKSILKTSMIIIKKLRILSESD